MKDILPLFRHGSDNAERVPFNGWMSLGEFVGTVLFLFFAFGGTQIANTANVANGTTTKSKPEPNLPALFFIASSFGASLAVNAWVFFRVSGGLFNPAVTLGMVLVGAATATRGVCILVSQILGGIVAAAVIDALTPGEITFNTSLNAGVSIARGVFIEMFCTTILKHRATFIAPIGIGLALFIAEIFGVFYTGGSVNPARSFGPAVASHHFHGYHWIYWVGPVLGALLASAFYKFIKILEYETANPGSDGEEVVTGHTGAGGASDGGGAGMGGAVDPMSERGDGLRMLGDAPVSRPTPLALNQN
ncbi:aquaporin-like protein [Choiromyces venosus 120613-1]|uniref:Aquaporin-like protein n=1 Tax=Choiromyces venosus 120613-1 TaxID=1336337 RepID=A0A3N4JMZ0_9PEZI|nr:aquaporin-like protein [Choiromyces venosus 120613-1]